MRRLRIPAGIILAVLGVAGLAWWHWLRTELPPKPGLSAQLAQGRLLVGERERTFFYYVPDSVRPHPALLLVFHGSGGDGRRIRRLFGYGFDQLADREGFVVVYPNGFEGHWNDCRREARTSAKREQVDDVGFIRALVDHFQRRQGADATRVFAAGFSNGGHMALRLALEAPHLVRAVAVVAASLPAGGNMDCTTEGRPVSVLVMNGTADPVNPYAGGAVSGFGPFLRRGPVLSTEDTVDYWRELAGTAEAPQGVALPDADVHDGSRVERRSWQAPGHKRVVLDTIVGGGHTIPDPQLHMPGILGPTNGDLDAAREIWAFFAGTP
jgi:polyhydroxybutyrate depolymerase